MLIQHNESVCLELIMFPLLLQRRPFHFTWKASALLLLINEAGLKPPCKMNLGTAPPSPVDVEVRPQKATELCCGKEVRPGEHQPCSGCVGGDDEHNARYHHPSSGLQPPPQVPARKRRAPVSSWAWALSSYVPRGTSLTWLCPCLLGCKSEISFGFACLSWFCVYTELCSSKASIIITTYWILFYAFNIV